MEAENVQNCVFYLSSSPLLWIEVLNKSLRTRFLKTFKNLLGTLESLVRPRRASQCCFPYFQCSESHWPHLMDVLLLAYPVLQNISSHAVMS